MSPGLKVIAPGLHSTIQDFGRFGYRSAGVPVAGALDRIGLTLANGLVGNPANSAALEILVQGPVLEVTVTSARLALVGGSGGLIVEGTHPRAIPPGRSVRLARGERVRTAPLGEVACAYLAAEGGFEMPLCLGSAATYARGRMGGLHGRALQAGDVVPLRLDDVAARPEVAMGTAYNLAADEPIRVVLGPQLDYFTEQAIETLLSATFTVSSRADRMGFRLDGPQLVHAKGYNIVSDGIVTGSIQVPGSGQAVVLLVDSQTTGGYPKIATVISADLPAIGRRLPGAAVQFAAVSQEDAEALRREQHRTVAQWIRNFRPVEDAIRIDVGELYLANLVDGVTSAFD